MNSIARTITAEQYMATSSMLARLKYHQNRLSSAFWDFHEPISANYSDSYTGQLRRDRARELLEALDGAENHLAQLRAEGWARELIALAWDEKRYPAVLSDEARHAYRLQAARILHGEEDQSE